MSERQVLFYACEDIEKQPPFNCAAAVRGINKLKDAQWRVPDLGLASDIAVLVDQVSTATLPAHLRFLRIRSDKPFKLSAARELTPVEVAQNEAITEFTWAVLWPDDYLAAVNMRDAPGHKKLARYFNATSGQQTYIVSLLRPDVIERLKEMRKQGRLRKLQVNIRMSELEKIAALKALPGFKSFIAAGRGTEAITIAVELSVGRGRPEAALSDGIGQSAEELAEFVDVLESMHVYGRNKDGEPQQINLKQERIGGQIDIEAGTSDNAIYRAIERTRAAVETEIGTLGNAARGS